MKINSLQLKNFKCLSDVKFEFGNLNLLAGANGCGKSSLMQSLLLLRQTYEQAGHTKILLTYGKYVNLGMAKDILYEYAEDDEDISYVLEGDYGKEKLTYAYEAEKRMLIEREEVVDGDNGFNLWGDSFEYLSAERISPQTIYSSVEEGLLLGMHGENALNFLEKYGDSIEKIQKYHDNSVEKYEKLSNYEEYISEIKRELSKVKEKLDIQCERLTALRKEAAIPLTKLIKEALLDLNFLDVVFEIAFEQSEHYSALGKDNVCFMISTNPGQAVRPLHEIASGGELSRIMLAIKSILADEENIETLIFDEIDTGISGRTAQKVSERLAYIAKKRQVIAITHLPQIAAMADSHYLIEKTSDANSTISNIYPLSEEESVKELARMLGGVKITEAVLQNAREMRALAKQ